MEKTEQSKIKKAFKEAFEENVLYSGFNVEFNEVNENAVNASFEGVHEFHLIGVSPAECLKALGGVVGEEFEIEDDENTIDVYIGEEDSAVMAFDGFRTIYFEEHDEDDAEEMGISLAKSLNNSINKIIDESKKKRSEEGLPLGINKK